ncbi:ribonuclease P protein component [Tremella mesenterica]|uniref:Ribonuclease P protein component n=1 Tax=Tremella mesenterica TaxID=5217 RepID=A0A4Q1BH82_TREME|nr:ribonuclease P protein component [Tremella mesenterica]
MKPLGLLKSSSSVIPSMPDFSALRRITGPRITFRRVNFDLISPIFTRRGIPTYRSSFFSLRSCRSSSLPPAPNPPFPIRPSVLPARLSQASTFNNEKSQPTLTSISAYTTSERSHVTGSFSLKDQEQWIRSEGKENVRDKKEKGEKMIRFCIIVTKNAVSKYAVERNRVKGRFKAAVEAVVNRGIGGDIDLLDQEKIYVANLSSKMYDAKFENLVEEVAKGLNFLKGYVPKRTGFKVPR